MLRLLERDGLVERRPDPADGRAARIHLTRRGRAFRPVAADVLAGLDALATRELTNAGVESVKASLRLLRDLDR